MQKQIVILFLFCGLFLIFPHFVNASRAVITGSDLTYVGSFQLSNIENGIYGTGLATRIYDGSVHLFSTGWNIDGGQPLVESIVPTPSLTYPGPVATVYKDWYSTNGGLNFTQQTAQGSGNINGLYWDTISSRLYYSTSWNYIASGDPNLPTLGYITLNDSTGTTTDGGGLWGFANRSQKQVNFGLTAIPSDFQTQYGVGRLAAGFGGYQSVVAYGPASFGPSLTAFNPPTPGTGTTNLWGDSYCSSVVSHCLANTPLLGYGDSIGTTWNSGPPPTHQRAWRPDDVLSSIWTDIDDPDNSTNTNGTTPFFSGDETFYWQGNSVTVDSRRLASLPNDVPSLAITTKHLTPGYAYWGSNDVIHQSGVWVQTPNKEGLIVVPDLGTGNEVYNTSTVTNETQEKAWLIYSRAQLGNVASGDSQDSIQPAYYPLQLPGLTYPLATGVGTQTTPNNYNGPMAVYQITGVAYDSTNQNIYIGVMYGNDPTYAGTNTEVYVYHVEDPTPTQYTVTINSGSIGTIMPSGSVQVKSGQSYLFDVIPSTPETAVTVSGCGGNIINHLYPNSASVAYQTGPITAPCTVTAFGGGSLVVQRGDVDGSSTTNTIDALLTLRNSLGLSMTATAWHASDTTGDVDCNGVSNSIDALLILRYSIGMNMENTAWCD